MPDTLDIFGEAYLDTDSFRVSAALFGAGMAMCDYAATDDGDARLRAVLQAASRSIDAFCGKSFAAETRSEKQSFNKATWQFTVNNPPVSEIVSCKLRYSVDAVETFPPANVFINNQKNYLEISRLFDGILLISEYLKNELTEPVIEIEYKSYTDVPRHIRLACGFQAGHLINSGYVDKMLPPNFGKIEIGDLSINNKKGYRSTEELRAGSISADAERLLLGEVRFAAS